MVRKGSKRINKYARKIVPEIIGQSYEATKQIAIEKQRIYFKEAEKIMKIVKSVVNTLPSIQHHFYIAFAEEVWKAKQKHDYATLLRELIIIDQKWISRGLDPEYLNRIKLHFVQAYITLCKFDVGRYDVCKFG